MKLGMDLYLNGSASCFLQEFVEMLITIYT